MVYLDWASTSVPDETILKEADKAAHTAYANSSSEHRPGKEAKNLLEKARQIWASCLGCGSEHISFTSGGTEANNLALQHLLFYRRPRTALLTGIEHASVYETVQNYRQFGIQEKTLGCGGNGIVREETLLRNIDRDTALVSLIAVHNETGTVQPLEPLITAIRKKEKSIQGNIHIHVDAVQAFGKIPFSLRNMDADTAVFSSHKIGGPKGAGILYFKKHLRLITGGGDQENNMRPGTVNLFSVYGSALAAQAASENFEENYGTAVRLMDRLLVEIEEMDFIEPFYSRTGHEYSPFINTLFIPPIPSEALVRTFSDAGIAVGAGSACSSTKEKKSRSLRNMGIEKNKYESALRVSIGCGSTEKDIEAFVKVCKTEIEPLVNIFKK